MAATGSAVILFDGECAFCNRMVAFVARRDPAGYFRFGASQSPQASALLEPLGVRRETARSIILIENGQAYLRSTATLRIAGHLSWPWSMASVLLLIPGPVRDLAYRVVAATRHRLAGKVNACALPPPELRQRMI